MLEITENDYTGLAMIASILLGVLNIYIKIGKSPEQRELERKAKEASV